MILSEFRERIVRLAALSSIEVSSPIVDDATEEAFNAIMPWFPKPLVETYEGDGEQLVFEAPADYYDIVAVSFGNEILPKASLASGEFDLDGITWAQYPHGYITLSKAPNASQVIKVYYTTYWEVPASEDDVLPMARKVIGGMIYYGASYILLPECGSSASISQYDQQIDSGNPEHNPVQKQALFLRQLFMDEMNRHNSEA